MFLLHLIAPQISWLKVSIHLICVATEEHLLKGLLLSLPLLLDSPFIYIVEIVGDLHELLLGDPLSQDLYLQIFFREMACNLLQLPLQVAQDLQLGIKVLLYANVVEYLFDLVDFLAGGNTLTPRSLGFLLHRWLYLLLIRLVHVRWQEDLRELLWLFDFLLGRSWLRQVGIVPIIDVKRWSLPFNLLICFLLL